MQQVLTKRIRNSDFARHNLIFFVGSLSMGVLNYLYYPVMGRLLYPANFGEVQALFSLFAQIAIFLNVLSLITVTIVANYDDIAKRNRVILELERLATLVSFCLLVLTLVAGSTLKSFFHFESMWPFMMLALSVLVATPFTFRTGYLRGKRSFGLVSLAGIVASGCDLLFSIIFVKIGWGVTGAIFGLALAQLAAFWYAAHHAKRQGFSESLRRELIRLPDMRLILPELKYAGLVLVGSLAITGLYSIDTIAVKHYFDASTAGLYAGISTIARIIFFLTASVAQVLLPSVRLHHTTQENQRILLKSFLLLAGLGGAALAIFVIVPRLVIRMLMGGAYLPYANLLPRLSLVIFIISILNLFIMYHMALRRYAIVIIVIMGITVTLGLLGVHHQTLQAVIDSLLYGSLALLACLGVWSGGTALKKTNVS